MMYFIHIPKTAGTSIYNTLRINEILTLFPGKYYRHAPLSQHEEYDDTKPIVTCIRDPYDRFYSMYNFFVKLQFKLKISFKEFASNYKAKYHGMYPFNTQCYYMKKNDKIMATDILRFEHLEEDWKKFCEKYKLDIELLHMRNVEKIDDIIYDEEIATMVKEIFAEDYELIKNLSKNI